MIFRNSKELHEFLNQNPSEISNTDDIAEIIKASIGNLDEDKDKQNIQTLDLERAVLSFRIEEFNLKPKFTFTN
ncbi:MAG: hypothetical protein KDE33_30310, partial [Bacteroidetes bacterium]|nr:hypothetical protein [Bacteroidota bacterium]